MGKPLVDERTIKIWYGDCLASTTDYPQYWQTLSPSEQQHALTITNAQMHRRYVEIRARIRMLLGNVANSAPGRLQIHKADYGKPYLVDYPEVSFNLSHSANKLAVAIAFNCDIGIDIEQYKARKNLVGLVDKCFAEEEKNDWQNLAETEKTKAFYRYWTRKEAFVKATGKGIAIGLKRCVIDPLKPSDFLRIPDAYGQTSEWLIHEIDLGESMCGVLVARSKTVRQITGMTVSLQQFS